MTELKEFTESGEAVQVNQSKLHRRSKMASEKKGVE